MMTAKEIQEAQLATWRQVLEALRTVPLGDDDSEEAGYIYQGLDLAGKAVRTILEKRA